MSKALSAKSPAEPFSVRLPGALLSAFDTNNRINQYLVENLPAEAWNAKPPDGKGRTVAAIVAHMHNVRVMWLKAAKADQIPEQRSPDATGFLCSANKRDTLWFKESVKGMLWLKSRRNLPGLRPANCSSARNRRRLKNAFEHRRPNSAHYKLRNGQHS